MTRGQRDVKQTRDVSAGSNTNEPLTLNRTDCAGVDPVARCQVADRPQHCARAIGYSTRRMRASLIGELRPPSGTTLDILHAERRAIDHWRPFSPVVDGAVRGSRRSGSWKPCFRIFLRRTPDERENCGCRPEDPGNAGLYGSRDPVVVPSARPPQSPCCVECPALSTIRKAVPVRLARSRA
jgi:hypothetical protein